MNAQQFQKTQFFNPEIHVAILMAIEPGAKFLAPKTFTNKVALASIKKEITDFVDFLDTLAPARIEIPPAGTYNITPIGKSSPFGKIAPLPKISPVPDAAKPAKKAKPALPTKSEIETSAPVEKIERAILAQLYAKRKELAEKYYKAPDKKKAAIMSELETVGLAMRNKEGLIAKNWPLPKKSDLKTVTVMGGFKDGVFHGSDKQVFQYLKNLRTCQAQAEKEGLPWGGIKVVIS